MWTHTSMRGFLFGQISQSSNPTVAREWVAPILPGSFEHWVRSHHNGPVGPGFNNSDPKISFKILMILGDMERWSSTAAGGDAVDHEGVSRQRSPTHFNSNSKKKEKNNYRCHILCTFAKLYTKSLLDMCHPNWSRPINPFILEDNIPFPGNNLFFFFFL